MDGMLKAYMFTHFLCPYCPIESVPSTQDSLHILMESTKYNEMATCSTLQGREIPFQVYELETIYTYKCIFYLKKNWYCRLRTIGPVKFYDDMAIGVIRFRYFVIFCFLTLISFTHQSEISFTHEHIVRAQQDW